MATARSEHIREGDLIVSLRQRRGVAFINWDETLVTFPHAAAMEVAGRGVERAVEYRSSALDAIMAGNAVRRSLDFFFHRSLGLQSGSLALPQLEMRELENMLAELQEEVIYSGERPH